MPLIIAGLPKNLEYDNLGNKNLEFKKFLIKNGKTWSFKQKSLVNLEKKKTHVKS